ncbi:MAG TPA: SCO family protein [Myxococcaceae bacterium]|nr:SCO family protein [Myxococcaceae bacterium]
MRNVPATLALVLAAAAWAQYPGDRRHGGGGSQTPAALKGVDVLEQLGDRVPEEVRFVDSAGRPFQLRDALHQGQPVILSLVYYRCPGLCSLVLSGLTRSLQGVDLKLGEGYRAVTVSIDPRETPGAAEEAKRGHLQALGVDPESPAWIYGTGTEAEIQKLARAVGFQYTYDEPTQQYAHPAVIFVLSPEGKISRYLYGIDFPSRDLKFALVEASRGRVGTTLDRVLLSCFKYDPASRRYEPYVLGFVRIGGSLTFLALATLLAVLWRQELKMKKQRGAQA